jgi:hypothetical protein
MRAWIWILILVLLGIGTFWFVGLRSKPPPVSVVAPSVKVIELGPKYQIIGLSTQDRKIESYTYGNGKTKLVFVGGIHGGYEWNSVLLSYQFMDYLKNNPSVILSNLSVTVIPNINPDGVFVVTGKEGRFTMADVSTSAAILASGRFNANKVDLNRNFDCDWKPESTWQSKVVSAGSAAFSEPEAIVFKNFVEANKPAVVIFWHSQANAIYASACQKGILPQTLILMDAYAKASGYPSVKSFDSYAISGAADDWLASIGIPAFTVELKTHEMIEWERNLAGIKALFESYKKM